MDWTTGMVDWEVFMHTIIKRTLFSYPRCCYIKSHSSDGIMQQEFSDNMAVSFK